MKTKNAMQLKALINNRARAAGINPQALMQNYLIERFLERLAQSRWRDDVVVKGGVLIASLVGVESRTTMDLDTTIRGFTLSHETAQQVFQEVASIPCDDDWTFLFDRTVDIRETDDYPGIRVHLKAVYPPISVPFTIDVTTGDKITPAPIEYDYPKLFDDGSIRLFAYPLEMVLAEKLETVISRGVTNTRPRDFYDIHVLWRLHGGECNIHTLRAALDATCEKRGSVGRVLRWERVFDEVENDSPMQSVWQKYIQRNAYAAQTSLQQCCATAREVMLAMQVLPA